MERNISKAKAGDDVLVLGHSMRYRADWIDCVRKVKKISRVTKTSFVLERLATKGIDGSTRFIRHYYSKENGLHIRSTGSSGGAFSVIMLPTPQQLDQARNRLEEKRKQEEENIQRQREYATRKDVKLRATIIGELEHNEDQYGPDIVPQLEAACRVLGIQLPYNGKDTPCPIS